MKIRIVFITLWVLSLVLVHLMTRDSDSGVERGHATVPAEVAGSGAPVDRQALLSAPRTVEKIVVARMIKAAESEVPAFGEFDRDIAPDDILRQLPGALRGGGNVMANNLLVAELLANLTPENVHTTLSVFENAERNALNDHNFRMFMYAWGEIDGQAATEYAFFNDEGKKVHYGGTSAMIGWSSQDPQAAKAFVEGVEDGNRSKGYMVDALVRGWVKNDLAGASDYVGSIENADSRRKLVEHLAAKI